MKPRMNIPVRTRTLAIYVLLVVLPLALGLAIAFRYSALRSDHHVAPTVAAVLPSPGRLLLALAVISLAALVGGLLARLLRQPMVVGQTVIGLALGPSLLGRIAPRAESWLFPTGLTQVLLLLGGIGAVFFVFVVGMDFSRPELRRSGFSILLLGQGAMAIPFLGGALLALGLAASGELPPGEDSAVRLFVALSMSVTAVPVLASILRERGLDQSRDGALGIGASVVGDATAWCLLAVALALAHSGSALGAALTSCAVVLFAAAMWFGARPALAALDRRPLVGPVRPALALCVLLLAALVTDSLGIDAVIGAFIAGLILPRSEGYQTVNSMIDGLTEWLLLPLFFVSIGLQVQLSMLSSARDLSVGLGILAVAVAGKAGATLLIARVLRIGWRSSTLLAAMMNCRGVTELVVLNVGLSAGLLDRKLFTMLTVVSVLTTLMTGPALDLIERRGLHMRALEPLPGHETVF